MSAPRKQRGGVTFRVRLTPPDQDRAPGFGPALVLFFLAWGLVLFVVHLVVRVAS